MDKPFAARAATLMSARLGAMNGGIETMDHPATQLVETVQGVEPCCDKHARQLAVLMGFMGSMTSSRPIPSGEEHECNNCRNEAKK